MRIRIVTGLVLSVLGGAAHAVGLEVALSNESAYVEVFGDSALFGGGGVELSAGAFYNDDEDYSLQLGAVVQGVPAGAQKPYSFGVGVQSYFIKTDDVQGDAQALALGGYGKYHFSGNIPIAIGAKLFYAPSITTFDDADNVLDFTARIEAELIPSTAVFLGYRFYRVDSKDDGNYELDDNAHLGVRFTF
jgi:hypothetical protein